MKEDNRLPYGRKRALAPVAVRSADRKSSAASLSASFGGYMSDEFHWLSLVVDARVQTAQLLDGNRPGKALGSWSLRCAKNAENSGGYLGPAAWSKQPEVSHRVAIMLWDVLRPPVDEFLDCAPHRLPSQRLLVHIPKPHKAVGDTNTAPLGKGGTPLIPPTIAQEVSFFVGLHMRGIPRALLFFLE